jgi:DNA-binding NtrC family response regulator
MEVIEADARVIAATNRDPGLAIAEGKLREDLYYRLNVFTITLPPLRERPEDIPPLSGHAAEQYALRTGSTVPAIHQSAIERLVAYPWPGNVRELKNAIERAALLSAGSVIFPEHLPPEISLAKGPVARHRTGFTADGDGKWVAIPVGSSMEQAEREMIRSTMAHTAGNKTRAAKILGISVKTMHNKIKKFEL